VTEMDLPESLHQLKRPALQKLCKKFGVRANGKVLASANSIVVSNFFV